MRAYLPLACGKAISIHSRMNQFTCLGLPRLLMFLLCEGSRKKSALHERTIRLAHLFVMCELGGMQEPPRTGELALAAGISKSYASEILSGARQPSRALAIHIFRKTGWRPTLIASLSEEQIDVLETIEPWSPREQSAPGERAA